MTPGSRLRVARANAHGRTLSILALVALGSGGYRSAASAQVPNAIDGEDSAVAVRYFGYGEVALGNAHPEEARRAFDLAVAASPTSRIAARASQRRDWLDRRAAEVGWAGLAAFLALRARHDAADTQPTAASLRDDEREVDALPQGEVKREAYAMLAQAWRTRLANADEAARISRKALRFSAASRPGDVARAGRGSGSRASVSTSALPFALRALGAAFVAAFMLVCVVLGRASLFARASLARLASDPTCWFAAYALGTPTVLAWLYDPAWLRAFASLTGALLSVVVFTRWTRLAFDVRRTERSERRRSAHRALALVATLACIGTGLLLSADAPLVLFGTP